MMEAKDRELNGLEKGWIICSISAQNEVTNFFPYRVTARGCSRFCLRPRFDPSLIVANRMDKICKNVGEFPGQAEAGAVWRLAGNPNQLLRFVPRAQD